MAKEMIISVNGREKKIAILDNGQVTEFYIERGGEENTGVVGNIYKGRVQRVLPGMQSAFVEIGLERDAFLYVSDFFDEEEEIERIMLDKGKKPASDPVEKDVVEKLQLARLEREKQMETVQELVEPLVAAKEPTEKPEKKYREKSSRNKPFQEEVKEEVFEETVDAILEKVESEDAAKPDEYVSEEIFEDSNSGYGLVAEEMEEPLLFDIGDSGFERIVDEDETTGEMFKDAYMQEAISDKVRAIEFNMESTPTAEVGSLFENSFGETNGFERIADDEEESSGNAQESEKPVKAKRSRTKKSKKDATAETAVEAEPKERKSRSKSDNRAEQAKAENTESSEAEVNLKLAESVEGTVEESVTNEHASADEAGTEHLNEEQREAQRKETARLSRKKQRGGKRKGKGLTEGEAAVIDSGEIAEMGVRRGGRRRRGSGNRPPQHPKHPEEGGETAEVSIETEEVSVEDAAAANPNARNLSSSNGGSRRDSRRDSRERNQPTISDLLREGQEIMVQIAKEPIARKGARITSHIALPGRYLVYMPTIEHVGVSRKIESSSERGRLKTTIQKIRNTEDVPSGGFIVRTAGIGVTEENLRDDARYLVRTWRDIKKQADKSKSPALVHQDLDLIQRILRDQLSEEFAAIRVDSEEEYLRIVEFVNRIQPKMVNRVKLYTRDEPILDYYTVQEEVDKALKPRVWLRSGGYLVINQTEALVAIDVNTGKFVGKGNARLEDTITKTNMEAVEEIARQIRLRDLGGIIVLDLIDMEDRRNRHKVLAALQDALSTDKSPTKVLSFNDFGLIIMTRKRVKQSLERTMCSPCEYCQGSGLVKSPQTVCYEILEEARHLSKGMKDVRHTTLRVNPEVVKALRGDEREVLQEIEDYLGAVDLTSDQTVHQEQFDFAFV